MKKEWFAVRWQKKGKKRTNTSSKAFTQERAKELAEFANEHFNLAKHWIVPVDENMLNELKGETSE